VKATLTHKAPFREVTKKKKGIIMDCDGLCTEGAHPDSEGKTGTSQGPGG